VIGKLKIIITGAFVFVSAPLFAQHLNGVVLDKHSRVPVAHATVTSPSQLLFTTVEGRFDLGNIHKGDTVKITCVGYKPYSFAYYLPVDTIHIYLEQNAIALKNVNVKARRDANADSINLRKQFANVFNYKATTFKDVFITQDPYVYKWDDFITSTNNATTILSVNLLSVLSMFNKGNAPLPKLQTTLIKDEQYNYVDQVFSKQKVKELTPLRGDSLQAFMDRYRPSVARAKTMSDYEVMIYIKKCYAEFMKPTKSSSEKH
jgi:hypothetical protein